MPSVRRTFNWIVPHKLAIAVIECEISPLRYSATAVIAALPLLHGILSSCCVSVYFLISSLTKNMTAKRVQRRTKRWEKCSNRFVDFGPNYPNKEVVQHFYSNQLNVNVQSIHNNSLTLLLHHHSHGAHSSTFTFSPCFHFILSIVNALCGRQTHTHTLPRVHFLSFVLSIADGPLIKED